MKPETSTITQRNHPEISRAGKPAQTGGMKKW
jgi:hypothetical protein